jgi:hypothetical protein
MMIFFSAFFFARIRFFTDKDLEPKINRKQNQSVLFKRQKDGKTCDLAERKMEKRVI